MSGRPSPRARRRSFKDARVQRAYEFGLANHESLMRRANAAGQAYRRGWFAPDGRGRYPRSWPSYGYWAAGVDCRRRSGSLACGLCDGSRFVYRVRRDGRWIRASPAEHAAAPGEARATALCRCHAGYAE